jgi:type IX secretion system PorP/SprF family membrane protein
MKRFLFDILIFSALSISAVAQNTPSFRQFYFNPVTFNPAYTGVSSQAELYVALRKQWLNFKDAPTYTGINFLYPTRGRVSFGFNFYQQEIVALRNSVAMGTFAYRIPISENQSLFFALSGGVGFNNLDLGGVDYSNDPTILNAALNTTYADGNFGVLYEWGNLRLGFALPKLLGQTYFNPDKLNNVGLSQLRNQNYSASYKFFSGLFSIEPWILYRMSRDNTNSWDAGTTVTYKEIIWLGSAYSDAQGIGAFAGINIKDRFRVGYSYEIPTANFLQTSSHEIQLRFRLGKKRDFRWAAKFNKPLQKDTVTSFVYQPVPGQKKQEIKEETRDTARIMVKQVPILIEKKEPVQKEIVKPITKMDSTTATVRINENKIQKLLPGYYIVTGSFKSIDNARSFVKNLKAKGFNGAGFALNESTGLYLVYVFHSTSKEATSIALAHFQEAGLKTYYLKHIP